MRVALINLPWTHPENTLLWGVRAGSRWPHFQKRPAPGQLPRYIPFPFFMAIAAAGLKQEGHDVLLIDAVAEDLPCEPLVKRLLGFEPQLLFTEVSTPSLDNDLALIRRLRNAFPETVILAGGLLDKQLADVVTAPGAGIDRWIAGEYDFQITPLVNRLAQSSGPLRPALRCIPSAPASSRDVDTLPRPLYEQLPIHRYHDPVCGLPYPSAQSWLSRGCPYNCSFCVWPQIIYGNRQYRVRDLDIALDEVQFLVDSGCESFYFDDDTANIGEKRMIELSHRIIERGLHRYPWSMMARADCMTIPALDALAAAGLYSIKYGVESVSPVLIDACGKATHLERFNDAVRRTRELGIKIHLTFTFGLPGETRDTIRETTDFCCNTAPETAQFSICTPFPGTRLYRDCLEKGYLISTDWRDYLGSTRAVVNTPELPARQLEEAYIEAQARWDRFVKDRLQTRRQALLAALRQLIVDQQQWTFRGDKEAAQFLWDCGDDMILAAYREAPEKETNVVIVSRHDEEKIWRQLQRNTANLKTLRLHG